MNSWLSDAQKAYGTAEMKACADGRVKGTNYLGTSLILESRIEMQFAFANAVGNNVYALVKFTDHFGEAKVVRIENDAISTGGYRVVIVKELVVADGRCPVTCEVYNADTNELVGSATDSMESYINRMANGNLEWMKTIMMFSDSAYEYLH